MISLRRTFTAGAAVAAAAWLGASILQAQRVSKPLQDGEWRDYAGDAAGMKYSPLAQITKDNLQNLKVVWRWPTADRAIQQAGGPAMLASKYEDTPLMVNGVLYTVTPLGIIAALDPATGTTRWTYDPEGYKMGKPPSVGFTVRGLGYWTDGTRERLLHASNDGFLISVDTKTGKPDPAFGKDGKVDITEGIRHAVGGKTVMGRRGVIAGDVVVIGTAVPNGPINLEPPMPPGFAKGFDVRTGRLLWTFNLVPRRGEFGYETWLESSAEFMGNANAWAGMAYDPELDYVYIPTSSAGTDGYGALRPGSSLFSDSLVCLKAKTGERVWHFQNIHHDLWDYDFPTHPALGEVTVNGRRIKAVIQINKNGFTFVLDRATGQPVWPIEERPVPQSTAGNGEQTWPTQPFPTKPPSFEMQGILRENLIDFTPDLRRRAEEQLKSVQFGPLFAPPSDQGTMTAPGSLGGANWGGAAFDPETGVLYVPSRTTMTIMRARYPGPVKATNVPKVPQGRGESGQSAFERAAAGNPAGNTASSAARSAAPGNPMYVDDLPILKPPYARVTALDLNKGDRLWTAAIGNGPRRHPALKDLNLPPLGDSILGSSILATKTLLFVSTLNTFVFGQPQPTPWSKWTDENATRKLLYVFDKQNGALLRVFELDGLSAAAPMTYMHRGKQYVTMAVGQGLESELVTFALP